MIISPLILENKDNPALEIDPDQEIYTLALIKTGDRYLDETLPLLCDKAWTEPREVNDHWWNRAHNYQVEKLKCSMLEYLQYYFKTPPVANPFENVASQSFKALYANRHKLKKDDLGV